MLKRKIEEEITQFLSAPSNKILLVDGAPISSDMWARNCFPIMWKSIYRPTVQVAVCLPMYGA